ncbi:serine hydrolase [Lactobacillus intestinalis]|uniref:serine hydrolase n=1 Tax=Lactobacillus intestinalis TaxID=151781 RepID=UPI002430FD54|nr:serine hydrolase [Lactobacillus intestinalis]
MFFHNRIKKTLISLVVVISLVGVGGAFTSAPVLASQYSENQLNLNVKSAIAVDSQTGQILYAKNEDKDLPIASMTKLITIYLTLEAIKDKRLSWNTTIKPTDAILKVANNSEYSNVPLQKNHTYTIRQLFEATLIESANGAAMCLANAVAGNQKEFVDQMRDKVKSWGIKDAKIYTSCGLPNGNVGADAYPGVSKNIENTLSAKDMAIIGMHLINDYPEVLNTTKLAHEDFKDGNKTTKMDNFNWMLKGLSQYDSNLQVDGLKTGTTDKAGACFIGTVSKNGGRIITVVMGARHQDGTDPSRFIETKKLINYIYNSYTPVTFKTGEAITGATTTKVINGDKQSVKIGIDSPVTVWDPKDNKSISASLKYDAIEAPVKKGQVANYYEFKSGKEKLVSISNTKQMTVKAQAMSSTAEVNWFVKVWRWITGEN